MTRFVYQLEYNAEANLDGLPPHDWHEVARFDHDIDSPHDVSEDGLHIDLYRDGEKYTQLYNFPTVPLNATPKFCEQFLLDRADKLLDQFERWHDFDSKWI